MSGSEAPCSWSRWSLRFIVVAGVSLSLNDSEGKITAGLQDHHRRLILVACLSILYAPAFVIYLSRLHDLLREHTTHSSSRRSSSPLS
jgi:hypothetical protein